MTALRGALQMTPEYLFCLVLFLAGLTIRNGYEILTQSGKAGSRNKIVFAVVFAAMCMMWAGWFEMCPRDPWGVQLSLIVRWVGLALVAVGFGLAVGSLVQLRGLENIDRLVSRGLYSKLRHPMYTGFIHWIPGWALYHGAVISMMVGLAGIGSILWWQNLEDASLEARFGDAFRKYRHSTWF